MNERIKELRASLDMKQNKFAERIGISQGHLSDIENMRKDLSDQLIKIICLEFNVNYLWLATGKGEMFSSADSDYTALIDRVMAGENEFAKNVFKMFAKFEESDWKNLDHMIDIYKQVINKNSGE